MKSYEVFGLFLMIRMASVYVVTTWFVPDEYWQSLEVGHRLAFGYGHLTWEWTKGIRNYLHPAIIAGIYKVLEHLKLDTVENLVIAPRVLQALLSTFADYRFYRWCNNSHWAVFLQSIAWFWFYTASRTLSNTTETAMTIIALSYYPWKTNSSKFQDKFSFVWIVELATFMRPTAVIPWLPLAIMHMKNSNYSVFKILTHYSLIGLAVKIFSTSIDCYICNRFIFTYWEFIKFNFLQDIASLYGTHQWYWYILTGLPIVLGITLLPFLYALIDTFEHWKDNPIRKQLLVSIVFTIVAYSCIAHKEFRFILPLLPMCLYITSDYLSKWSYTASSFKIWFVAILLLLGNALPALYFSRTHQRGIGTLMPALENIAREYKDKDGHGAKLFFLMPCHSTPYYSHIHQNVTMRFLTCEPNFNKIENYVDEADKFYSAPMKYLRSHIPIYPLSALPTHVILYDTLLPEVRDFLLDNYKRIQIINHTDIRLEKRIGKQIFIYERVDRSEENQKETRNIYTNNEFDFER